MTERLYDSDAYLSRFTARVVSCEKTEGGYAVILDRTAFFPEEGGQSADGGTLGGAKVLDVRIKDGVITHITNAPLDGEVTGEIDFAGRYDKMQQHTGEHIVCGIVHELFGYNNVGFHLGDTDTTFDFDGRLTADDVDRIELLANEAVQKNAAVRAYYPPQEELESLEYRAKSGITGGVRVVEIEGIDRCACCAPHVSRTGEVGVIKLTSFAAYKGGVRIHMVCGMRAVRDFAKKQKNLEKISAALSCTPLNADEFFERYREETERLKRDLSALRREIIALRAAAIPETDGNIVTELEDADPAALRQFCEKLSEKCGGVCLVKSGQSFAAASKTRDLRGLAAALRERFSARCGGNAALIQGTVQAPLSELEKLIDAIK